MDKPGIVLIMLEKAGAILTKEQEVYLDAQLKIIAKLSYEDAETYKRQLTTRTNRFAESPENRLTESPKPENLNVSTEDELDGLKTSIWNRGPPIKVLPEEKVNFQSSARLPALKMQKHIKSH